MDRSHEFPAEWWTERRKRDYYVDETGEVRVREGSETDIKIRRGLVSIACDIAAQMYDSGKITRVLMKDLN